MSSAAAGRHGRYLHFLREEGDPNLNVITETLTELGSRLHGAELSTGH